MGLGPRDKQASPLDLFLEPLAGPDLTADEFPIPTFLQGGPALQELLGANRAVNKASSPEARQTAIAARTEEWARAERIHRHAFQTALVRGMVAEDGFRERLHAFWTDHFTVTVRRGSFRHLVSAYAEEAIRPRLTGRFAELLTAAALHPMMLMSLDQDRAVGPGSRAGKRTGQGLNENLARELMELHTLGVEAGYSQDDVREMAELLTGVSYSPQKGFRFLGSRAEPGAETILGQRYGGRKGSLEAIHAALEALALHPETARHIASKLAVHFVAEAPSQELIEVTARRFLETDGNLLATYEALLSHPDAWVGPGRVKQPLHFLQASLRALDIPPAVITRLDRGKTRRWLQRPLQQMDQPWQRPAGPDGWPESDEAWISPHGLAARISWTLNVPVRLAARLPDPREFAMIALGPRPPEEVLFAAGAAETVEDGVGLVLASSAFQRS